MPSSPRRWTCWIARRRKNAIVVGFALETDDAELSRIVREAKMKLERGVTREAADFNPLKIFRSRK